MLKSYIFRGLTEPFLNHIVHMNPLIEDFIKSKRITVVGISRSGKNLEISYRKTIPWILNFAIKDDWKDSLKEEWIEETLSKFRNSYKQLGITYIAFPGMGAMNGGIPLETIKSLTRKYLQDLDDINIEIYEFDSNASNPFLKN